MSNRKITDLLPALIEKNDKAYVAVQELADALQATIGEDAIKQKIPTGRRVKNIAITGPYGSGKSSIIQTLEHDYPNFNYLNISLATLRVDNTLVELTEENEEDVSNNKLTTNDINNNPTQEEDEKFESLNRRIEYSILQQIIYKENSTKVKNSRLRRIRHYSRKELVWRCIGVIIFLLCFLTVFEPSWLRVESFYEHFNFGKSNFWFDLSCSIIMVIELFVLAWHMIQSYSNSKLNKLNLKDGEIELQEASIFNKHLDEILYFFQVTKYNVVVIEDVDRFGTKDIFLKLRELNQLINESNVIGRPVVFVYAVKDDIFRDEDRVKCFDYLITVIPAINPSNSKGKLKELLAEKGYMDFKDDDLSEMGFFIQDMRLLINIVNEYDQYHQRLITDNANLDGTKLLGMIVYKNFYPRDFARLHRREGLVYKCLQLKPKFIEFAGKDILKREKELNEQFESAQRDCHLRIEDLRRLFIDVITDSIQNFSGFNLDNNRRSKADIANNDSLFNSFLTQETLYYFTYNGYQQSKNINVTEKFESTGFSKRIKALKIDRNSFDKAFQTIAFEKMALLSMRIKDFFDKYDINQVEEYNILNLPDLLDVFIRRGYLDEDYYDYISYFYEGMISISDRETLIFIKRQKNGDYLRHIDHIENFTKELKPHNFVSDAILYVELLDYLVEPSANTSHRFLPNFYKRINRKSAPLKFLATYYIHGKHQTEVFTQFVAFNPLSTWQQIIKHTDDKERDYLLCAWLKFAKYPVQEETQKWINCNYEFISKFSNELTDEIIHNLCEDTTFDKIELGNSNLINSVIKNNAYSVNANNLAVILAHLENRETLQEEKITLTKIWATESDNFIDNINDNIKDCIQIFSKSEKDESAEALKFLINQEIIEDSILEEYISGQVTHLESLDNITPSRWQMVIGNLLVEPEWTTLQKYQESIGSFDTSLFDYIQKFSNELGRKSFGSNGNKESLFFNHIFSNPDISFDAIKKITPVFEGNSFNGDEKLLSLNPERLLWYLDHDMLLFSDGNTAILRNTSILIPYFTRYKEDFISVISEDYLTDPSVVISLLDSSSFDIEEKSIIIKNIPVSLLSNNSKIAGKIICHIVEHGDDGNNPSYYITLLQTATTNEYSLKLAIKVIDSSTSDRSVCDNVLNAIGSPYTELIDANKNPKFDNTETNRKLLETLKTKDLISSYNLYKDNQIRAYHSRK